MMAGNAIPVDWTSGTGTVTAGGTITVNAEPFRQGIYVENRDTTPLSMIVTCTKAADGTSTTATITLAVAGSAGAAGGSLNSNVDGFFTNGAFTVVGTAGKQCTVLTV